MLYSLYVLKQPLFILYLDARSAFDEVIREILVRDLFFFGTINKDLLYINHRLEYWKTYAEWDMTMMGPISDEVGVEQGGVNSGDYYKIYGRNEHMMAQQSGLGVKLSRDLVISVIGQADDTALVSNKLHSIQNLLQLSLNYCSKANIELCPEKTVLQAIFPSRFANEVNY